MSDRWRSPAGIPSSHRRAARVLRTAGRGCYAPPSSRCSARGARGSAVTRCRNLRSAGNTAPDRNDRSGASRRQAQMRARPAAARRSGRRTGTPGAGRDGATVGRGAVAVGRGGATDGGGADSGCRGCGCAGTGAGADGRVASVLCVRAVDGAGALGVPVDRRSAELQAVWLMRTQARTAQGWGTQSPAAGSPADGLEQEPRGVAAADRCDRRGRSQEIDDERQSHEADERPRRRRKEEASSSTPRFVACVR